MTDDQRNLTAQGCAQASRPKAGLNLVAVGLLIVVALLGSILFVATRPKVGPPAGGVSDIRPLNAMNNRSVWNLRAYGAPQVYQSGPRPTLHRARRQAAVRLNLGHHLLAHSDIADGSDDHPSCESRLQSSNEFFHCPRISIVVGDRTNGSSG
ncbi:MAG TPA: hypothetical protein VKU19_08970 [Bryobacteraceae bacterium]|nr:hypothetical protein [Bryobacteraceae bacterium]